MSDLKIQHLLTLVFLLSRGARHNFVPVTTSTLGRNIKKSQQAASRHLVELEDDGFIERSTSGRATSIRITPKGYSELEKISGILQYSIKSHPSFMELKGTLVSGMGEGAYYMSLSGYTKQFKKKIGYIPFPGTLNVRLDKKHHSQTVSQLDNTLGVLVRGFSDGRRTYGWVRCFEGTINKAIKCHLIRLERTHHDTSIVELISHTDIRSAAKLKDGSKVTIRIPL